MADIQLAHRHWNYFNETDRVITLYGSRGEPFAFGPGDRYVFPKQIEGLNAIREYKATLEAGGMGGGKSVWLEQAIFDLFFEWSTPGHYHGPLEYDEAGNITSVPCMLYHENVRVFLISQTLRDIRLRHIEQILLPRYGDFGTLNKNEWEFTLHEEYGSHMLTMIGTDNLQKLRSIDAAAAAHDECTLDSWDVFKMTLKRLRWFDHGNGFKFPHCPWFGATNTTGISRADYKENFVDHPREEYVDESTGEKFPGFYYIHINAKDNPALDSSYLHELQQGSAEEVEIFYEGSWDREENTMFTLDDGIHIVEDIPIPTDWPRALSFDFGWDHPAVMESFAMNPFDAQIRHHLVWSMDKKGDREMKIEMYEYARDMGYPIEGASVRVGDISAKRGDAKLKAAGLAESSTWKYFNSPTEVETAYGKYTIPSFQLRPAWKKRIEGWRLVREEFAYKWEWRSPDGIPANMTNANRIKFVTRKPGTIIHKSCWQTVNSLTILKKSKTVQDDAQKTTGCYGPGKGDDEAEDFRYGLVAFRKGFYGKLKEEVEAVEEAYNPRQHRSRTTTQRGSKWA
jgi:hypothetical protein